MAVLLLLEGKFPALKEIAVSEDKSKLRGSAALGYFVDRLGTHVSQSEQ